MKFFLKKIRKYLSRLVLPGIRRWASIMLFCNKLLGQGYTKIWQYSDYSSYEHRFDYLRGIENFYWMERGIIGLRYLLEKSVVLDLGCGDGFFSGIFYSTRAQAVDAIDYDSRNIKLAKKYYQKDNVNFYQADITRIDLSKKYDAIYLFAVIEHFTVAEGEALVRKISSALDGDGFFMGSTPLFSAKGGHNIEHQNEFSTEQEVKNFMIKSFEQVETWVSPWPNRQECYFLCRQPK